MCEMHRIFTNASNLLSELKDTLVNKTHDHALQNYVHLTLLLQINRWVAF